MTDDPNEGDAAGSQRVLSDDVVESMKRSILHGVGYGRPPASGQFKKGQSGNPKGRPKELHDMDGPRSTNTLVLSEAERPLTVREGEERRQMPAIEAVHRAQYAAATRGNAYAQKHIIERYDRAERDRRRQIADETETWTRYVAVQREAIADANRKGDPPPTRLPHPDDVIIDYEQGVRFIGPLNEEGMQRLAATLGFRDALIMQDALDQRQARSQINDNPFDRPGTALAFASLLNEGVPGRYRLSETEIIVRMMRYAVLPKRTLLKDLRAAWRALGTLHRRGSAFPPLRFAAQAIELLTQEAKKRFA